MRTDDDHVELEATLQELVLDLLGDGVETDVGVGANLFSGGGHCDAKGKERRGGWAGRGVGRRGRRRRSV